MAVRGVAGQALFELSGNLNQKELKNVDHTVLRFHLSRFFDFCCSLCLCIYSVFFQIVLTQNVSVLCFILTRCLPALWSIYARRRGNSCVLFSVVPSIPCSRLALIGKILHPQQLMHSFIHAAMGMLMAWCATVITKGQYSFLVVPCTGTER